MPGRTNSGTFTKGYIQPPEMRRKRSETMKRLYAEGKRKPPQNRWTEETRKHYTELARQGKLDRVPIGRRRLGRVGNLQYWEVKVNLGKGNANWVREHRHMMEQHLGRSLQPGETVHHINGDSLDNRLDNLALLASNGAHTKLHAQGRDFTYLNSVRPRVPPGKWTRKHDSCIECHRTDCGHASSGLCRNCYARMRRRKGLDRRK